MVSGPVPGTAAIVLKIPLHFPLKMQPKTKKGALDMAAVANARLGGGKPSNQRGKLSKSKEPDEASDYELETGEVSSNEEEEEDELEESRQQCPALKRKRKSIEESQEELRAIDERIADLANRRGSNTNRWL